MTSLPRSASVFFMLRDDELYQLFVARSARGTGVAAVLIDDAEARLAARGMKTACLHCAVGNDRAARFYEKRGWTKVHTALLRLETEEGAFEVAHWRFEKSMTVSRSA